MVQENKRAKLTEKDDDLTTDMVKLFIRKNVAYDIVKIEKEIKRILEKKCFIETQNNELKNKVSELKVDNENLAKANMNLNQEVEIYEMLDKRVGRQFGEVERLKSEVKFHEKSKESLMKTLESTESSLKLSNKLLAEKENIIRRLKKEVAAKEKEFTDFAFEKQQEIACMKHEKEHVLQQNSPENVEHLERLKSELLSMSKQGNIEESKVT